jgi:DNA sulfur modification protein DndD
MQLLSLNLQNWSSYKGDDNEIVFATTPGSQITVITAKNGFGKTSVLKAFSFVFFGDLRSTISRSGDEPKLEDFPNRPALEDGEEITTSVSLKFKHEGEEWILRREFTAKQSHGLVILGPVQKSLVRVGKGGGISNETIDDFINDFVINKQVSHFYFFDGVLLEAIQSQLTRKDDASRQLVMRSVENALGLRFLDHLNQNLRSCLALTDDQIEAQQKALNKNEALLAQIAKDQERLVAIEADIEGIAVLMKEQEDKRAEHEARLRSIDPATKEKAVLRAQYEVQLKSLAEERAEAIENIRLCGEKAWLAPLNSTLTDLFSEREQKEKENAEARRNYSALAQKISNLKASAADKSCSLCGQEHDASKIKKITDEIADLEERLSEMEQPTDGSSASLFKLSNALRESQRGETMQQALSQENAVLVKIADITRKIRRINDDLGDFQENIDVKWEETQRAEADSRFKTLESEIAKQKTVRDGIASTLESNRAKLTGNDTVSKKDQDTRSLLATLCSAIESSFEGFRNEMRFQVQEKATEYLGVLTSEPEIYGSVEISPEYQIRINTPEGVPLQITNAGHKQILTTAFVSAMAAVSSDKTPFVMDTALSHLDNENSNQMLEWAKYVDQQVVLLVTPKELPQALARKILGPAIGREYMVEKLAAEVSIIKEVVA